MRVRSFGFLVVLLILCFPGNAWSHTQGRLSGAEAARAIRRYENNYWKVFPTRESTAVISQCKRYNATHISCLAKVTLRQYWAFSRDWVTLTPKGYVVVHSGHLALYPRPTK